MSDIDREEIFDLYETEVYHVAEEIAHELVDLNEYESLEGREWCEENDVPETAFADAVDWYIEGVDYGISPMYPFRAEEEVIVSNLEGETDGEE